jgi:hypothetical protein
LFDGARLVFKNIFLHFSKTSSPIFGRIGLLNQLDDPQVKQQLILDRLWQQKLDAEAPLDDGYVDIGGFRERRTRYGFTKHWRDPDF